MKNKSLTILHKRLDRIESNFRTGRQGGAHPSLDIDYSRLDVKELEQYCVFQASIRPRVELPSGEVDLNLLSDEELAELKMWYQLLAALEDQRPDEIARCRAQLEQRA